MACLESGLQESGRIAQGSQSMKTLRSQVRIKNLALTDPPHLSTETFLIKQLSVLVIGRGKRRVFLHIADKNGNP